MLQPRKIGRKDGENPLVAVAVDKDKGSQYALKYAVENLLDEGQTVLLIHVKVKSTPPPVYPSSFVTAAPSFAPLIVYSEGNNRDMNQNSDVNDDGELDYKNLDSLTKELFLPFRVFCTRKDVKSKEIVLHNTDVSRALVEYINETAIEVLVIGSSNKSGFLRKFKTVDIPGNVSKGVPDFCTVYSISKGKVSHLQAATRPAPANAVLRNQIISQDSTNSDSAETCLPKSVNKKETEKPPVEPLYRPYDTEFFRSPFTRRGLNGKSYGELSLPDSDISYVSSGKASIDRLFPPYDSFETGQTPQLSFNSDTDNNYIFDSTRVRPKSIDIGTPSEFSFVSEDSDGLSTSSQAVDEVEAEMRRLKLELKQTMEMYSTACKEALTAKEKAKELQRWKLDEAQRLEEARLANEATMLIIEREKAKSKAAMDAAEAAQRIAELEAQKRIIAEMKALKEAEEKRKVLDALEKSDSRYRKYSIEEIEAATEFFVKSRKIGEGGYGPVYKCYLDHTPVAIKVLRPDAAQGRSQFQQEVEVLSCIRHPNMVLLLGACPEYGCLVYEYMANGSLEDCLFKRGSKPPLSWQLRFKIAAEIGTGLLFLHQTKPEPLVHRDLKPANILLDRNYVSKISDVGLARLVPPSVADNVTQYRMTSTAGTFCYIDPEYQQTGMLGIKSDVYSLGILFLQLITARSPMGLTHHVSRAIENGTFAEMLDPSVTDWPVEEALCFAKLSLKCAELRRKDRPDLGKVVLPELNRLRALAEDMSHPTFSHGSGDPSPNHSQVSLHLGWMSDHPSSYSEDS